jgi:ribosomal protein S18 acetylase RimI-like enzyme
MRLQKLGLSHFDAILELWQRSGLSTLRPQGRDSREAFTRQMTGGVQTVLGLVHQDRLLGVVVVTHDGRKGWINRLAVDPAHRGRGYGTKLIQAAEETLRAQDIHVIAVLIKRDNQTSLALFQKAGYQMAEDICYLSKRDSTEA